MFLIKPLQRITHYRILIQRLLEFYGTTHHDYQDTLEIFIQIDQLDKRVQERIHDIENRQKLMDLQRDLIGVENLFASDSNKNSRRFIREGSLQKLSRKGYQQRMFFLVRYLINGWCIITWTKVKLIDLQEEKW